MSKAYLSKYFSDEYDSCMLYIVYLTDRLTHDMTCYLFIFISKRYIYTFGNFGIMGAVLFGHFAIAFLKSFVATDCKH